jgi:hypothetical protein
MPTYPIDYIDRFDPAKGYDQILVRPSRVIQAAELNEMQRRARYQTARLAGAFFKDGAVVKDASLFVNAETGACQVAAGQVYANGDIYDVAAAEFSIPIDRLVAVGVYLHSSVVTELEDPTLYDPAPQSRNLGMPGAARLKIVASWGWDRDAQVGPDAAFFPVYRVDQGVVLNNAPPPALDGVAVALARYDRAANGGSYVANGLAVAYQSTDPATGEQVFTVADGVAHIDGYEVNRPTSLRVRLPGDADLAAVDAEPHQFTAATGGTLRIILNHTPVAAIDTVRATVRIVEQRVHGPYTAAIDPLTFGSVVQIVSVVQGATTYQPGTDYRLTADQVDWTPQGAEPAPGSTYTVTYDRLAVLQPTGVDQTGFTINGPVANTQVLVSYRWKLPRVDRVALDRDGQVVRIKGVSHPYTPAKPAVPAGQLLLATVTQSWSAVPTVSNDGVHAVPNSTLERMGEDIVNLYMLVAKGQLTTRANGRDPAAKRGVFVDAFFDGAQRDAGVVQDAAIVDGELTLPIFASVQDASRNNDQKFVLDYSLEVVLEQPLRTAEMKVNPYQAFDPLPANVTLVVQVDQWTATAQTDATWQFSQRRVDDPGYHGSDLSYVVKRTESSSAIVARKPAEYLRPITVAFAARGFGPGERLHELRFDGLTLTPNPA